MQSSPWTAFSLLEASLLLFAMLGWGSARNGSLWAKGMFLMMSSRVDWRTPDTCSLNFTQFSHSGSFRDWWVYMPTRTESRVLFPHSQHHLRSSAFFQTNWYKRKKVNYLVVSDSLWPQAPLSMEFSRQESWSGLPFPSPGFCFPGSRHHLRSSAFFQTDWYKETIFLLNCMNKFTKKSFWFLRQQLV